MVGEMGYIAGPVHTLADYQVEYDGFLMGAGTEFGLPPIWEFLDLAPLKTMDEARDWADGSYTGTDFADILTPSLDVEITGTSPADYAANVMAFRNQFTIGPALPLWVKLPGFDPFGIAAKVNKRVIPIDQTWESSLTVASLQWRMTDPVWQSVPRSSSLSASGSALSGMVFPLLSWATGTYAVPGTIDFGSTATSSSGAILTNAGNADSWAYVVITGPCPGGFTVVLDGDSVTYSDDVPTGATVIIDYKSGTAQLVTGGGSVDRTYVLTARNFSPVPGESSATLQFLFAATSGSAVVSNADMWR
jgi:hypothetical protein